MKHCVSCNVLLSEECVEDLELRGMPCPNCRKSDYFPTVNSDNISPLNRRTFERMEKPKINHVEISVQVKI